MFGVVSVVLLIIFSMQAARTIRSLVRPPWRNAHGVTVKRLTARESEFGHFVMAVTNRV